MPTGSPSTTAKPTACMPATASCSTTNRPCAAKPSSPARSPARWPASSSACRTACYLGNMDAKRDWGHAKDYVEMQWLMLQQEQAEDFVIATGVQYSVRDFVNAAAKELGMSIRWEGQGVEEKGYLEPVGAASSPRSLSSENRGEDAAPRAAASSRRSPLLPPHRSRNPARRPQQGQEQARLDAEDHVRRTGGRDGARGFESRRARRAGEEAWLQDHGLSRVRSSLRLQVLPANGHSGFARDHRG